MSWLRSDWLLGVYALAAIGCDSADATAPDAPEGAGPVPAVATLEEAAGDVRLRAATTATWSDTVPGQELHPADSVQTMTDSTAAVRFREGGSLARLGPSTTLRIPEQPPEVTRLTHVSGRLVARVDGAGARRMEVDLPPGTLVLESAMEGDEESVVARLDVASGRTEIAMVEGEARLRRAEGDELRVEAESFVALGDDGAVLEEGMLGEAVTLLSPSPDAELRVRGNLELEWEAHPDAVAYRVEITDADGETSALRVQSTTASVSLGTGAYRWTVRGIVGDGLLPAAEPRALHVRVDRTPPALSVVAPRPGAVVEGAAVEVAGATDPGATVWVDGRRVAMGSDGSFRVSQPIPRGLVNVVVRASDDLGNARVVSRSVTRP